MQPDKTLDITGDQCPMTFVKTKLALEGIEAGQFLEVFLNSGEPVKNVPRSLRNEGHKVVALEKQDDGTYRLLVEKEGGQ
ncbi:sulfurtransferase TusA family protein [Dethiobacter alkaliphilus]|uniref:SirA family protein n=1 Tax=Dethiobacter alkaliphilus AHT 1 TaxID=555088 RepID=C0GFW8_DETAL|nr:sulfurtransferase TusA family protein [Dethiobacter alkaliphilus]EEG77657.1 SirA family protein [Dethiobacter alkaliphilus AHT 1]